MQVTTSSYTVAEYCDQVERGDVIINHNYQRTDKVWPPAARSYLIDTILFGYPIPKFSLYQKTDLRSRRTIKEVVDGQQRTQAIIDFYKDKFKLSGKGEFSGRKFSQLNEDIQQRFISYQLTTDVFVGASPDEIREVFRRINSYNVPLNPQERRHAVFQGAFKWFVVETSRKYAQLLINIGVFTERQLSRMSDAEFFSEISLAFAEGIVDKSNNKLEQFYKDNDPSYGAEQDVEKRIDNAIKKIVEWKDIHNGPLMKPFLFYSLLLAVSHCLNPVNCFQDVYNLSGPISFTTETILPNLGLLASVVDQAESDVRFADFSKACSGATTRIKQRQIRFKWLCRAINSEVLP